MLLLALFYHYSFCRLLHCFHLKYIFTSCIDMRYNSTMIKSFKNKVAEDIFHGSNSRQARKLPSNLHEKARRLLDQLNAAPTIDFLKVPPGNRLERLFGDYKNFWSIRINKQWRIVFRWKDDSAYDISIIDYH